MLALYLHVPFCRAKCPYCDFFSVADAPDAPASYPDLLCEHLRVAAAGGWKGPFETVFFGGGTPSLLPPEGVGSILEAADRLFGIAPGAEISLEANPGTLSLEKLAGFRAAGVNRISLGVQSLREEHLSLLGRIHTPGQARQAIRWAREAGFANLSCDLIFALPGLTEEALLQDVADLLAFEPDHLSCYGLTVEEETPFYHLQQAGGLPIPDEDEYARQFLALDAVLEGAGYRHYEISNYARPGRECRHNEHYWRRRAYLGIGAGAHSFCSREWGARSASPADLAAWGESLRRGEDPAAVLETFDRKGAMSETLYLGLRTAAGVADDAFRARFGIGVQEAFPQAVRSLGGRLRHEEGRWFFAPGEWLLYDSLIVSFL